MRIVKEFNYEDMLVTIFKYEDAYSFSIKNGLYEQIYKCRSGQLQNMQEAEAFVHTDFLDQVKRTFVQMQSMALATMSGATSSRQMPDEFEEII